MDMGGNVDYSTFSTKTEENFQKIYQAQQESSAAWDAYRAALYSDKPDLYTTKQIEDLYNKTVAADKKVLDLTNSMMELGKASQTVTSNPEQQIIDNTIKAPGEISKQVTSPGLEKFLATKAPSGGMEKMLQSDIDAWTDIYNNSKSLQERYGDFLSSQASSMEANKIPATKPEQQVVDLATPQIPDVTAQIPDVVEKTVTVQIKPEYVWMSPEIPSVSNNAKPTVQEISQQFTWVGHAEPNIDSILPSAQSVVLPVSVQPEYTVTNTTLPDLTGNITLEDQVLKQSISIEPDYQVIEKVLPDVTGNITLEDQVLKQSISIEPLYKVIETKLPDPTGNITLEDQVMKQSISIEPNYQVMEKVLPDVTGNVTLEDQVLKQSISIEPEYQVVEKALPDITGSITDQSFTQPLTIIPQYSVQDVPIPNISDIIQVTAQSLSVPVTIEPDYSVLESAVPDITIDKILPNVVMKQPVTIEPEYIIQKTSEPNIDSLLPSAQSTVLPVSVQPEYTVTNTILPDLTGNITDQSFIQPVTVIPQYSVQDVPMPNISDIIQVTAQSLSVPVTIEPDYSIAKKMVELPEVQVSDKVVSIAANLYSEFSTSAVNIESAFTTMIQTVKLRFEDLEVSVRSALSTGSTAITPATGRGPVQTAPSQPNITYRDTYYNYYTLPQKTDVRQLADEVARILDKGAKRVRV